MNEELGMLIGIMPATIQKKITVDKSEVAIEDMEWDPYEDNLLVSFADGSLSMVSFQGLTESTIVA